MKPFNAAIQRSLVCLLLLLLLAGCQTTYHLTGSGVTGSDLDFLEDIRASRHLIVQASGSHLDGSIRSEVAPFNRYLEEALAGSGVFRSVTVASARSVPADNDNNPLMVTVVMNNQFQQKEGIFFDVVTSPFILIYTGLMVDIVRWGLAEPGASFSPGAIFVGIALSALIPARESYMLSSRVQLQKDGTAVAENRQQNKVRSSYGPTARLYGKDSDAVKKDSAQRTALQIIRLLREQGEI